MPYTSQILSGVISIHTPIKGVTLSFHIPLLLRMISIHTPIKGVTRLSRSTWFRGVNFNPHTHKGCDIWQFYQVASFDEISIHTPIKGVTIAMAVFTAVVQDFNPHTHKGCDCVLREIFSYHLYFNPHTHKGCDVWH